MASARHLISRRLHAGGLERAQGPLMRALSSDHILMIRKATRRLDQGPPGEGQTSPSLGAPGMRHRLRA